MLGKRWGMLRWITQYINENQEDWELTRILQEEESRLELEAFKKMKRLEKIEHLRQKWIREEKMEPASTPAPAASAAPAKSNEPARDHGSHAKPAATPSSASKDTFSIPEKSPPDSECTKDHVQLSEDVQNNNRGGGPHANWTPKKRGTWTSREISGTSLSRGPEPN